MPSHIKLISPGQIRDCIMTRIQAYISTQKICSLSGRSINNHPKARSISDSTANLTPWLRRLSFLMAILSPWPAFNISQPQGHAGLHPPGHVGDSQMPTILTPGCPGEKSIFPIKPQVSAASFKPLRRDTAPKGGRRGTWTDCFLGVRRCPRFFHHLISLSPPTV